MASDGPLACERCGRIVTDQTGCPVHRGARLLDLRRPDDRAWRQGVLDLQRQRNLRLGGTVLAGLVLAAALFSMTSLISVDALAQLQGEVGLALALRRVLSIFSGLLILVGSAWGSIGAWKALREIHAASDSIERQAASRELVRRVTGIAASVIFGASILVLRGRLIGVPAELIAAATALVLTPPLQSMLDFLVEARDAPDSPLQEPSTLLPPVPDHILDDTREADPLERLRRGAFRKSIMDRR